MDSSLYGTRPPKRKTGKDISSSTTLAFTSQLSSLISTSKSSSTASTARPRPSKTKSDIFTVHNKGAKKRAAADLLSDDISVEQVHKSKKDVGEVDSTTLQRSKRKMEEKARLYAAMKRGDYIPPSGDASRDEREKGLVDFDKKWAEQDGKDEEETSSDDNALDSEEELVEYEDEFGRQRRGTRAEAAREERRRKGREYAALEADEAKARPAMPENIIYGDTVQAGAFNPDEQTTEAMEELARKRDRSATPPERVHYDASNEVRSKGVGFFQFSKDEEVRKKEMETLEKERVETERRREEQEERKRKRKAEIEERRKKIGEKRAGKLAEGFLEGLGVDLDMKREGDE
jgi:hypothetical protein